MLVFFLAVTAVPAQDFKFRKEIRESTFGLQTLDGDGTVTGFGTGVVVKIDKDGTTWMLTAAHVTHKAKKIKVWDELRENKKVVGEILYEAEVIRESPDEDLALLRVKKKNLGKPVVFGNHKEIDIDSDVAVCGTFSGEHVRVVTLGKVQGFDVEGLHKKCRYNMATMTVYKGASGGGMYDMNGKYIGMFVALRGNSMAYYITVENIREWAKLKKVEVDFIFDDKAKRPKNLNALER
jgi:S1-C subfamily serine protease